MKEAFKELIIKVSLFLILVFSADYLFKESEVERNLLNKLMCWGGVYFCLYISLIIVLSKVENKFIIGAIKILGLPLFLSMMARHYLTPIFTIMMFTVFYFFPTALVLNLSNIFTFLNPYLDGIIYLVNVFTVLIFAYLGNKVMQFIMSTLRTEIAKDVFDKYFTVLYTRIYSYVLMILIYVIYNFMAFSQSDLLKALPIEPVSVIKEVFVTFVAIDTLIQILLNQQENKKAKIEVSE
ncbi:hypothetical protein JDS82_28570 [Bacillus cereus group sp. N14]|uniref:hypothetical protein n=1 Tax=Bacillus cereus group sp. N14 TaxID=2794587 RepID=UPI0018F449D3|nr:hypothetical protein [Bacillus cereus group sp. N14]MBJ8085071.1 hypothetical protein [Bacillus cereus group sp. N14]